MLPAEEQQVGAATGQLGEPPHVAVELWLHTEAGSGQQAAGGWA